jgi:hypothetical protein
MMDRKLSKEDLFKRNELIAKFDGFELEEDGCYRDRSGGDKTVRTKEDGFYYNTDYNWIMPVVDKIRRLKYPLYIYQSHIQCSVEIYDLESKHYMVRVSDTKIEPIEILFEAVYKFIKIYNSLKK